MCEEREAEDGGFGDFEKWNLSVEERSATHHYIYLALRPTSDFVNEQSYLQMSISNPVLVNHMKGTKNPDFFFFLLCRTT